GVTRPTRPTVTRATASSRKRRSPQFAGNATSRCEALLLGGSGEDAEDERKTDDDASQPPAPATPHDGGDPDDEVERGQAEVKIRQPHTERVQHYESHEQRGGNSHHGRSRTRSEYD